MAPPASSDELASGSTSSEDELVPAGTTSSSTAMNTLWQRGLQWYRRSKASVVVRMDSPHTSGRPTANTGGSGERAAASANHAAASEAGLVIAMQGLSSPDELPRILGVVYEREGLRALPKLAYAAQGSNPSLADWTSICHSHVQAPLWTGPCVSSGETRSSTWCGGAAVSVCPRQARSAPSA